MNKQLFMIDLFCGAGGVSEGSIQAGFTPIFSSDISSDVEKTYVNRHNQLGLIQNIDTYFLREDIRNLNGNTIFSCINNLKYKENFQKGDIPLVFGGPSCQGFSLIGKRDKNDLRNTLFKEYIRIISEIMPKYAIMENVVGFMSFTFNQFEGLDGEIYPNGSIAPFILKKEFEKIGYNTLTPKILNAMDYGVPQNRKRAIFIAYRKDQKEPTYPKPFHSKILTLNDGISDLNGDLNLSTYQLNSINGRTPSFKTNKPIKSNIQKNQELPNHNDLIKERFSLYKEGETTFQLRERILNNGIDISNKNNLIKLFPRNTIVEDFKNKNISKDDIDILLTKKNIRRRLDRNKPCNTVVTIADDFISPFDNRTFTVRELARLQSFDDSFEFLGKRTTGGAKRKIEVPQYSQVGNAVPPLLAKAICLEIKKCL